MVQPIVRIHNFRKIFQDDANNNTFRIMVLHVEYDSNHRQDQVTTTQHRRQQPIMFYMKILVLKVLVGGLLISSLAHWPFNVRWE
jgi:hypothetical protein